MSENTLPPPPLTEGQQDILSKIDELVEKGKDRELTRALKALEYAKAKNAELEAQIIELKTNSPDVQAVITQHQAAVKVHSVRAKQAIADAEEVRRDSIVLRRTIAAKNRELADALRELADTKRQLEELTEKESAKDRPEPTQENSTTRLRRSRRSSQIPG